MQLMDSLAGTVLVSDAHGSCSTSRSALAASGLVCQTVADVCGYTRLGTLFVLEAPTFSDIDSGNRYGESPGGAAGMLD